jgi:hypothetical protein
MLLRTFLVADVAAGRGPSNNKNKKIAFFWIDGNKVRTKVLSKNEQIDE